MRLTHRVAPLLIVLVACGGRTKGSDTSDTAGAATGSSPTGTATGGTATGTATGGTATGTGTGTGTGTATGSGTGTGTGGEDCTTPATEPAPVRTATVVDCGTVLDEPAEGLCNASPGAGDATVLRGRVLAPDEVLVGGEVLVDAAGDIVCVGCDCSAEAEYADASVVTCPDAVVSPGLVNPHDHLSFTEGWPIPLGEDRYEHRHGWRFELDTPGNPHGGGSSTGAGNRWGELRMLFGGTTSMVGSSRAIGMVRNLEYSDGLEGLPMTPAENETFPLGDSDGWFEDDCGWDFSHDEWTVAQEQAFIPHTAEGIDDYAAEEFFCSSRSDGAAEDLVERNVAHVHAVGLTSEDYLRMALDGSQIIWSPRSNIQLYGITADVVTFHRFGGTLALGTDWTYSGSINLVRELACADAYNARHLDGYFSDYELWRMATVNGAVAASADPWIGSLETGKVADIAVFADQGALDHRAILEADVTSTLLVLRAGEPLYGEADVLAALGESCEAVDVCGLDRAVCAEREFGETYSEIAAEVSGSYPAIFCGVPDDEPTCTPLRRGEFTGEITGDDGDGDGIVDSEDNCPTVFNPIRPIDGGVQPDADGDGAGDPCDVTPLLQDLDGDGCVNSGDNCPFDSNGDQADGDGDGKGAVCDTCDATPNADGVCPPAPGAVATIAELQEFFDDWDGEVVRLDDVVVTGVGSSGFTLQDPAAAGAAWSGIYVFTGDTPTVARGEQISIEGQVSDYFGETQIQDTIVVASVAGPPIAPVPLTIAEATAEEYESVLVTLTDGAVTDDAYDCGPPSGGACADEGLWELDGESGVVVYDRLYEDGDWESHIGALPVTGVMSWRWDRRRIMPRTAGDF
ncbi:MAG: cytosine/adenosine deaminase-related metal-dependent hydrolase [Myxococcota bacterium]|jgi:cytosine/adenosine deaminase-related metal-dependent hydrolase